MDKLPVHVMVISTPHSLGDSKFVQMLRARLEEAHIKRVVIEEDAWLNGIAPDSVVLDEAYEAEGILRHVVQEVTREQIKVMVQEVVKCYVKPTRQYDRAWDRKRRKGGRGGY